MRLWPHLRAALVLFHLVAVTVVAFPAPVGGLARDNWKVESVQRDFAAWAHFFHVAPADFEDFLWAVTMGWAHGRDVAVAPFVTYMDWTGCDQPWRMFVGPDRNPLRMQVQAHRKDTPAEAWDTLFEELSTEHRWHSELFSAERVRSQLSRWGWPSFSGDYETACEWISKLALTELPDVDAVRCRFKRTRSLTPDEARAEQQPAESFESVREHHR